MARRAILGALGAAALLGCQTNRELGEPTPLVQPGGQAADVIAELAAYGSYVRTLGPAELEEQYVELSTVNEYAPSDEAAIKLSLLLSNPAAPFHDVERALRLLDEVAVRLQADDNPRAGFPRLVHQLLIQQHTAVQENETVRRRLAEERERSESLAEALATTETRLEAEAERRRMLQEQLDALKALEEQINLDDAER